MPIARTKRKCVMKQNNKGQITISTGLVPSFRVSHPHRHGATVSLKLSLFIRFLLHDCLELRLKKKPHLVLVLVIKQHLCIDGEGLLTRANFWGVL